MQASSPLDRVKASFSRSRSDSPTSSQQHKRRSLTRIFSSTPSPRSSKFYDGLDAFKSPSSPQQPDQQDLVDPRSSPTSSSQPPFHAQSTNRLVSPATNASVDQNTANLDNDSSHVFSDNTAFDERDMKRRLMDMESSFLPDIPSSSSSSHAQPGVASSSSPAQHLGHSRNVSTASTNNPGDAPRPLHFHRPLSYIRNQAAKAQSDSGHPDDSFLSHSHSSPSLDAAHRSRQRLAAQPRNPSLLSGAPAQNRNSLPPQLEGGHFGAEDEPDAQVGGDATGEEDPEQKEDDSVPAKNRHSLGALSNDSADRPGNSQPPSSSRPDWLKQRQASQRSSGSSILSFEGASDMGLSGSGGITPGSFSTVRPGHRLSRLPSLGSVGSSMSAMTDRKRLSSGAPMVAQETCLEPLDEEHARQSPPDTPRNNVDTRPDPTQTVLAQHVRDVEVPTTVARRFKAAQVPSTTGKASISSPLFGRVKNELTLKEQNSRIDKLSKENFDLKLKIHYLYQALQDRSDEGVKDLIAKNAQLQTDAVRNRKDNQSLKKRVRELERELRAREDGLSAVRTGTGDESEDALSSRSYAQAHLEDEILYLRDKMQALEEDNERLRLGDATQKLDDRRLAERLKSLDLISNNDEADGLRAELNEERMSRERADLRVEELYQELSRVRGERSPVRDMLRDGHAQQAQQSVDDQGEGSLSGSTLVEQLRSENANLRRDLGAQTSMLSSRNRERERLQQEIEDLKLVQRRGDLLQPSAPSISGDSILDRSVSRNNMRPSSREGALSGSMGEAERDEFETREARLRDENAGLRMRNQDLQKDLDMISYGGEHLATLRDEHDEAIRIMEEERDEAAETVDKLEALIEQKDEEAQQLLGELRNREDDAHALEVEIREISASFSRLVDDSEARETTIQELQQDLTIANGEVESLEQSLKDVQAAKERLEVQAESSQSEIAFLREEQEGDKIRLSDLQSALTRAKSNLRGEKEKMRALEELEAEVESARGEARQLRKSLTAQEEDAAASRGSLDELEGSLRQVLGSSITNKTGFVSQIKRLQRDFENSLRELNRSKAHMAEKERQLDETRGLVDSHTTEAEQLHAVLNRERDARRRDRSELEKARLQGNDNTRVAELERELKRDRDRLASLEEDYQFHLRERSKLMYNVWTRVAALCGSEWLSTYTTLQGRQPPTFESVTADPSSVDEPLALALDALSHNMATSRSRIRATEKELYGSLDHLHYSLDERDKRLAALEKLAARRGGSGPNSPAKGSTTGSSTANEKDLAAVRDENRLLRREVKMLRQANFQLPGIRSPQAELDRTELVVARLERERDVLHAESSPSRRNNNAAASTSSTQSTTRRQRSRDAPALRPRGSATQSEPQPAAEAPQLTAGEQRLVLQLKEVERRLLAEREARVLDREGARERINEGKAERDRLRVELAREREKGRLRSVDGARGRRLLVDGTTLPPVPVDVRSAAELSIARSAASLAGSASAAGSHAAGG